MAQNQDLSRIVDGKMGEWEAHILNFDLPAWSEIPDIGLYMDQVISQLVVYLDYLAPDIKGEALITKTMINNYVRMKVLEPPVKKRYYRRHIAMLVMICLLKQSLSISQIAKSLPQGISEETIHCTYDRFVEIRRKAAQYFCSEVKDAVATLRGEKSSHELTLETTDDVVIASAIVGGYSTMLASKIIDVKIAHEDLQE